MRHTLLLLLFLTISLISCKPKKVEVTYPSGKIMELYEVNRSNEKEGKFQMFFESGAVREESYYKKGSLTGIRTLFFENGNKEIEESFSENGVMDGVYKVYYPTGELQLEKTYVNNEVIGTIKVYYKSGKLKEEVTIKDNQENGPFTEYYQNGEVHWKGTYLNGDNEYGLLFEYDSLAKPIKIMKCDSIAICRTIWKPGMPQINLDTVKI